jgi:hypothetical protein
MKSKRLRVIAIAALVLLVVLGGGWYYLCGKTRDAAQRRLAEGLSLSVKIGSARPGLWGGGLVLKDVRIGSPQDYGADPMLHIKKLVLTVPRSELDRELIHVESAVLHRPTAVVEELTNRRTLRLLNAQRLLQPPAKPPAKVQRLIIDRIVVEDAALTLEGVRGAGTQTLSLPVKSLRASDWGQRPRYNDGMTMAQACGSVMMALLLEAADDPKFPAEPKPRLLQSAAQVLGQHYVEARQRAARGPDTAAKDAIIPSKLPDLDKALDRVDQEKPFIKD